MCVCVCVCVCVYVCEFVCVLSECDRNVEESDAIVLHYILSHDSASPYYFWLQRVKSFKRDHPNKRSMENVNFHCDPDLEHIKAI